MTEVQEEDEKETGTTYKVIPLLDIAMGTYQLSFSNSQSIQINLEKK